MQATAGNVPMFDGLSAMENVQKRNDKLAESNSDLLTSLAKSAAAMYAPGDTGAAAAETNSPAMAQAADNVDVGQDLNPNLMNLRSSAIGNATDGTTFGNTPQATPNEQLQTEEPLLQQSRDKSGRLSAAEFAAKARENNYQPNNDMIYRHDTYGVDQGTLPGKSVDSMGNDVMLPYKVGGKGSVQGPSGRIVNPSPEQRDLAKKIWATSYTTDEKIQLLRDHGLINGYGN